MAKVGQKPMPKGMKMPMKKPPMPGQMKKGGKKGGSRAKFIEEHYGDMPLG